MFKVRYIRTILRVTVSLLLVSILLTLSYAQELLPTFDMNNIKILDAVRSSLNDVRIGEQYIIVASDVYELVNSGETQPQGYSEYVTSFLEVWAVDTVIQSDTTHIMPLAQHDVVRTNGDVSMEFAVSSTEQFVALSLGQEIAVFSLPDLELRNTIPLTNASQVAWSREGNVLAASGLGEIIVWDVESDIVYNHNFENEHFYSLQALPTGWLLDNRRNQDEVGFSYCDVMLSVCQVYSITNNLFNVVAQHDGNSILVPTGDINTDGQVQIWSYQETLDSYEYTGTLSSNAPICPREFSPNDTYLFSFCDNWIWDFDQLQPVQQIGSGQAPAWFSDEAFFMVMDLPDAVTSTYIYQLGNSAELSQLNFANALGAEWETLLAENEATLALALQGAIHVSEEDNYAIIDLDWGVVFVSFTD